MTGLLRGADFHTLYNRPATREAVLRVEEVPAAMAELVTERLMTQ